MKRQEIYAGVFGTKALFITGLVIMPALLFNPSTEFRALQFLFFWFLTWLSRKKINPFPVIFVIFGIVVFNLIVPYGRILFSVGMFRITEGALITGINRAVTFEGLVMLSKVSIRSDIKLPGAFGELLSESLRIFSFLVSRKHHITAKNFIEDIDNLMMELSHENLDMAAVREIRTKPLSYAILAVVIIVSWMPWIWII
jgi:heptaprenyl diphosphate synthase